tara:strand:- start:150 stop:308 length:159 start_codon:yes stop_codon:yes gene_type:complete
MAGESNPPGLLQEPNPGIGIGMISKQSVEGAIETQFYLVGSVFAQSPKGRSD